MNEIALIKNSLTGERIAKQNNETIFDFLSIQIPTMYVLAGQVAARNDVMVICKAIYRDLMNEYKSLTLKEVEHCLNQGVRGAYGDYYGINVVTINKWLRTYYNSDERKEAQSQKLRDERPALPARTELSEREKEAIRKQAVERNWNEFNATGACRDTGNVAYNYLDENGLILLSENEISEIRVLARKQIESEIRNNPVNIVRVDILLKNITENGVESRAKKMVLNILFARLKEDNKNLEDLWKLLEI